MRDGNLIDATLFAGVPLLPAPRFGSLPALLPGQKRFLAAMDGIYVEACSHAMSVRLKVGEGLLPYGPMSNEVRLSAGPVPRALLREFVERAQAQSDCEIAAAVVLDGEGVYRLHWPTVHHASAAHVHYADQIDDDRLVLDLHTHATGPAFFSAMDDASDRSRPGPYFACVVGRCDRDDPELVARAVLAPYLQPLAMQWLQDHGIVA
jgi:PRTRC genetic system protein A